MDAKNGKCDGYDDSDRSKNWSYNQAPAIEPRNRHSRGLSGRLRGPFPAGSATWPFAIVPPPQQSPLAHPTAVPRSREEKRAQAQVIKLLAVQEKTRTLVRSISKLLPSGDHRQQFHEEVVSQQLQMERHHQSLLKKRYLSVTRAMSGANVPTSDLGFEEGMGDNVSGKCHLVTATPDIAFEEHMRLDADLALISVGTDTASLNTEATTQKETPCLCPDVETPMNFDSSE